MASEQMSIGRFSQMTRLTQKALRLYDERGILIPAIKDPMTGYRYYSIGQIEKGVKIKFLVSLGFNLQEVADLLNAAENNNQKVINSMFAGRLSEVRHDIHRLEKVESILLGSSSVEGLLMSTTEPAVKDISPLRVVSRREKVNLQTIGMIIGKLIGEIMGQIFNPRNKGQVSISGPIMSVWNDMEYKEVDIDMEIAVPITGRITVDPEFEIKNLPKSKVVFAIHTGAYETVHEAYTKVLEYAAKNGYKQQGPMRELYLTNPNERPAEENMTEIHLPVE